MKSFPLAYWIILGLAGYGLIAQPSLNGSELRLESHAVNTIHLFEMIERKSPRSVQRNIQGDVIGLTLPFHFVNDTNLVLISESSELRELRLHFTAKDYGNLSVNGFNQLHRVPHLTKLYIGCPRSIPEEYFASICALTNLRALTLQFVQPAVNAYFHPLTNLAGLEELTLRGFDNFGDAQLRQLSVMHRLRQLELAETSVSIDWLNIIRTFPALTNIVVSRKASDSSTGGIEKLTWSRYR